MEILSLPSPNSAPPRKRSRLPELVFVYGTLKRNEPNNHVMRHAGGTFMSRGVTFLPFPLIVPACIPYLLPFAGHGVSIHGEIFLVPSRGIRRVLDRLEGHPDWYFRNRVQIVSNDKIHTCWTYFLNEKNVRGDWKSLPFLSRYTFRGQPPPLSETQL